MCSVGETSGLDVPVARGPVPRDHWMTRAMARDRPSPYGEGGIFYRSAGACPPRALDCADDGAGNCACGNLRGPTPYDEGETFCRRGPGRAALLHRDQEVSPTGIYETLSEITSK